MLDQHDTTVPDEVNAVEDFHTGAPYLQVLGRLHALLKPQTYMEIGTNTGRSLSLAQCAAIAVDPRFKVEANVIGSKSICLFYQMTSDRFFETQDAVGLLGGPVDLAFLDGMHQFEFLLRDFYNTERLCRRNSIVVLHDCMPVDINQARRVPAPPDVERKRGGWTGDVWKTLLILKERRPDLRIHCFKAPPTGLVCITNLDPANTYLKDNFFPLIDEYSPLDLRAYGLRRFLDSLNAVDTTLMERFENITRFFWL